MTQWGAAGARYVHSIRLLPRGHSRSTTCYVTWSSQGTVKKRRGRIVGFHISLHSLKMSVKAIHPTDRCSLKNPSSGWDTADTHSLLASPPERQETGNIWAMDHKCDPEEWWKWGACWLSTGPRIAPRYSGALRFLLHTEKEGLASKCAIKHLSPVNSLLF